MNVLEVIDRHLIVPNAAKDQHFLADELLAKKAVALLEIKSNDIVYEVGAGIGTLTEHIPPCELAYAVEIDSSLIPALSETVNQPYLKIVNENALIHIRTVRLTKILSSTPYSICEPLLHALFELQWERASLILPERFANIILTPTTPLGFFSTAFITVEKFVPIKRDAFIPQPRTRSKLIVVTKRAPHPLQSLYLFRDSKVKNLIREQLINSKGITKREARNVIEKTLPTSMQENLINKLNFEELDYLKRNFF